MKITEKKFKKLVYEDYLDIDEVIKFVELNNCPELANKYFDIILTSLTYSSKTILKLYKFIECRKTIMKKMSYILNSSENYLDINELEEYFHGNRSTFYPFIEKYADELNKLDFLTIINYMESNNKMINRGSQDLSYVMNKLNKDDFIISIVNKFERDNCAYYKTYIKHILKMIFDEVFEHENKTYADIRLDNQTEYSISFNVGTKRIKYYFPVTNTYKVPNSKYLLQPIIRHSLKELCNSSTDDIIEVSEKVDTKTNIPLEEIKKIKDGLKEEGLIYKNYNDSSFGILNKDNNIYWNKPLGNHNGLRGENNQLLKKGE